MGDHPRHGKMKAGQSQAPKVHIKKFFSAARKQVTAAKRGGSLKSGNRLYVKGVVAGFRRALTNQKNHTNLIKIQDVEDRQDVEFYLGKKIMYMYKAQAKSEDGGREKMRVMWGKVCAKFSKNLPPSAIGGPVRIMLFPSRV